MRQVRDPMRPSARHEATGMHPPAMHQSRQPAVHAEGAVNVLVGMEESQTIQQAFAALGHNAYSCDLKPCRGVDPARHVVGDVFEVAARFHRDWQGNGLIILHPVCRYLSVSGQHWVGRPGHEDRAKLRDLAISDFLRAIELAESFRAGVVENPISIMSRIYRQPDQIIQPWQHGDDASKQTCLWLFGEAATYGNLLKMTEFCPPRMVCQGRCRETRPHQLGDSLRGYRCMKCSGKVLPRWANQTDSGQNRLAPTADPEDRRAARATTYPGPARAMAVQWGGLL